MSAVAETSAVTAVQRIRQIEESAPRLYSRWSARAWRLLCEGPAMRLWDSLAGKPGAEQAIEDYLLLAREAVGLQYLSASEPADLEGRGDARSFLAEALCDAVPRLLAGVAHAQRARILAQLWNVGERLASRPLWLNRYLAARLRELDRLDEFEGFLVRVLGEGLDEGRASSWAGPFEVSVVDPAASDPSFLPGIMHLATPSIVCVHDRRRSARNVAVLLRPRASGGPMCLGSTPCLAEPVTSGVESRSPGGAVAHKLSMQQEAAVVRAAGLDDAAEMIASRTGFVAIASTLSQRIHVVESRS